MQANSSAFQGYEATLGYRRSSGPVVTLQQLSVHYQKNVILDKLDLTFAPNKTTAIVGANGSGKSTLIKAILGQYAHEGTIKLAWPKGQAAHIAYVPQHIDFDRELPMHGEDFLGMLLQRKPIFLGMASKYREIVHHLLDKVSMSAQRHTKVGKLSGGELKRMLLIQALYPEPGLVLLDEPMTALDEPGVAIFTEILRDLQAMGKTIIWVEHDLMAVRELAHELVAINRHILHTGSPSDLADSDLLMRIFSRTQKSAER